MKYIIEIKTLNEWFLKWILKTPSAVYWNMQLSFYADKMSELLDEEVTAAALLVCRNTANMVYMPVEYEDYKEHVAQLNAYYENDILPPCEEDKCDKCDLKKLCKKNEFGTIAEFIEATKEFING
jgi:hypothetical protein